MKKLLFIIGFFGLSVSASERVLISKDWHIHQVHTRENMLGVEIKKNNVEKKQFYSLNLLSMATEKMAESEFRNKFFSSDKNIISDVTYSLNKCISKNEIYHSEDSTCESANFTYQQKDYKFEKDPFYKWEVFIDPIVWDNKFVFKRVSSKSKSGDTGKWREETIYGLAVFELDSLRRKNDLAIFDGSFISLLTVDNINSYMWIGNEYGLYGYSKDYNERISCLLVSKNNQVERFFCVKPDYLLDNKKDQARLLLEKDEAIKLGKQPPKDYTKKFDDMLKKSSKKKQEMKP